MAVEVRWGDGIMTGVCILCCHTSLVLLSSVKKREHPLHIYNPLLWQHTDMTVIVILALYFLVCSQILFSDPNIVVMPMSSLHKCLKKEGFSVFIVGQNTSKTIKMQQLPIIKIEARKRGHQRDVNDLVIGKKCFSLLPSAA